LVVAGLGRLGFEPNEGFFSDVFRLLFAGSVGLGQWVAGGVGYVAGALFGYRKAVTVAMTVKRPNTLLQPTAEKRGG